MICSDVGNCKLTMCNILSICFQFYIDPMKLLPLQRFLPGQPRARGGRGRGGAGGRGGGRGQLPQMLDLHNSIFRTLKLYFHF